MSSLSSSDAIARKYCSLFASGISITIARFVRQPIAEFPIKAYPWH